MQFIYFVFTKLILFCRFHGIAVFMLRSCGGVLESSSCMSSVTLLECAVPCVASECFGFFPIASSYMLLVLNLEIASAKMLSFPPMWTNVISYSQSSITHLSNFAIFMPLDRNGSNGL